MYEVHFFPLLIPQLIKKLDLEQFSWVFKFFKIILFLSLKIIFFLSFYENFTNFWVLNSQIDVLRQD